MNRLLIKQGTKFYTCALTWIALPWIILYSAVSTFVRFILFTCGDLLGTTSFPVDATHVPTFYAPQTRPTDLVLVMTLLMGLGTIFGGIHCAGWNLAFPTDIHRLVWRLASSSVTMTPTFFPTLALVVAVALLIFTRVMSAIVTILGSILIIFRPTRTFALDLIRRFANFLDSLPTKIRSLKDKYDTRNHEFRLASIPIGPRVLLAGLTIFTIIYLAIYVIARLILVVQAVMLLRSQPPGAFLAVDWSKFYPHVL